MPASKPVHTLSRMLCLALVAGTAGVAMATAPDPATLKKIAALAVPFVPNAGQWDSRAAFAAKTFAGTLFVTHEGQLVYSLPGKPVESNESADAIACASRSQRTFGARSTPYSASCDAQQRERTPGWSLTETLVDGSGKPRRMAESALKSPAGYRPMQASISYFIGNDESKHAKALNTYERVNLGDMYPGINVQLRATGNNIEKIFTVAPQQDAAQINISINGTEKLEIGTEGELIAHTGNGPVSFTAPIAYQQDALGERTPVVVAYALNAAPGSYRFTLGDYDRKLPLVIDPLLQSTYLGAAGLELASAIAIHPSTGEVYLAGSTTSAANTFPGVGGGAQGALGGGTDAFVSRFSADLSALIKSSYLGAAGDEQATAIAIHPTTGEVYVAGHTTSTTNTFPGVSGGAQDNAGGSGDAFVSRFSASLGSLLQSSYLGADGEDFATALAVHPATGNVYVAGYTLHHSATPFPGVGGGAQVFSGNSYDAFVSRFSADLHMLIQSSYLGADGYDRANAIAIHPATGEIYVAGYTTSTSTTFPGVGGGAQGASGGNSDAFVSRFSADLTTRIQSSYLGAAGDDLATALAIHPISGEVYVAGRTGSTTTTFPGIGGGAQGSSGGGNDAFVSRFSADLTTLIKSSYLGAAGDEQATALAIHPASGEVYVAGYTTSATNTFPGASGGAQDSSGGDYDAFVSRFSADLTTRIQSSYLGAAGTDLASALAIHPATGEVYVAGYTGTTATTFPGVNGGAQGTFGGGSYDAFVSRFSADLTLSDTTPNAFAFALQSGVPTASQRTSNPALITGIVGQASIYVDGAFGSSYCISSASNCLCNVSAQFVTAPGTITNDSYVCVRHTSALLANEVVRSKLHVGSAAASFVSTTGTMFASCNLDIDGSGGAPNAVTDGLMLVRAMLGFTGTAVTNGAIFGSPPRNTWPLIRDYLNQNCGTSFGP